MTYKIVFFDLDGTLLNEEKQIPADTVEAVRTLKQRGVDIVIATGRAPYFFSQFADQLGVDSYVSLNGSYVEYKGRPVYEHEIPPETLERLEKVASEHDHPIVFQGSSAYYANYKDHPDVIESFIGLKVPAPSYQPGFWRHHKIYQALLYAHRGEGEMYRSDFPNLSFVRWHPAALDVIPRGGSKATGIQAILQQAGIAPSEAVAFGDGLNDLEMLQYVGLGIAMGNARDDVKPHANFVTKHVNEGGIAYGLEYAGLL